MDWSFYKDKLVLVTGHTGFKGSWLITWLQNLGANVIGLSLDIPTSPSNFEIIKYSLNLIDIRCDINDKYKLIEIFRKYQPDMVFHLAAQPIVKKSYENPLDTFQTNSIGSLNIIQAAIECKNLPALLMITSDKCYQNKEWHFGYREIDTLGGDDPYSASKAAAEIMIKSFYYSYRSTNKKVLRLATARAGNVIGGGDWAPSRIVPDCIRAWNENKNVKIYNPNSTRPWQHVLEPLGGYLWLMEILYKQIIDINGESFNFGPSYDQDLTVANLVEYLAKEWGNNASYSLSKNNIKEAGLLKLNCDKAKAILKWSPVFSTLDSMQMTAKWYKTFYSGSSKEVRNITDKQIEEATLRLSSKKI